MNFNKSLVKKKAYDNRKSHKKQGFTVSQRWVGRATFLRLRNVSFSPNNNPPSLLNFLTKKLGVYKYNHALNFGRTDTSSLNRKSLKAPTGLINPLTLFSPAFHLYAP